MKMNEWVRDEDEWMSEAVSGGDDEGVMRRKRNEGGSEW
jgi:hypothetical protein